MTPYRDRDRGPERPEDDVRPVTPAAEPPLLALQRTAGNAAVTRLLQREPWKAARPSPGARRGGPPAWTPARPSTGAPQGDFLAGERSLAHLVMVMLQKLHAETVAHDKAARRSERAAEARTMQDTAAELHDQVAFQLAAGLISAALAEAQGAEAGAESAALNAMDSLLTALTADEAERLAALVQDASAASALTAQVVSESGGDGGPRLLA